VIFTKAGDFYIIYEIYAFERARAGGFLPRRAAAITPRVRGNDSFRPRQRA
jgi:hypothetical protein